MKLPPWSVNSYQHTDWKQGETACLVMSRTISWPGEVTSRCLLCLPGNPTVTRLETTIIKPHLVFTHRLKKEMSQLVNLNVALVPLFPVFTPGWGKCRPIPLTEERKRKAPQWKLISLSSLLKVSEVNEENGGKNRGRSNIPDTHPDRQEMIKRTEYKGLRNSSNALVLLKGFFRGHGVC